MWPLQVALLGVSLIASGLSVMGLAEDLPLFLTGVSLSLDYRPFVVCSDAKKNPCRSCFRIAGVFAL